MTESNEEKNSQTLPWYKEGLKFQCTGCGQCCTGTPGYVWVNEEEMEAIAKLLEISVEVFKRKYVRQRDNRYSLIERKSWDNQYDCIFLKDKKCTIYQARPNQCRTFPWWKHNLNTEESWKLAALGCEGIHDEAPLVPFEEIDQKRQEGH